MSFLGGGAECSTGRNPLAQLSKAVNNEAPLQRDRLVARPGPMGVEGGMRTAGGEMQQMDKQMMDEFYTQQAANTPFAFGDMRQEIEALQRHQASAPGAIPAGQNWSAEFGPQFAHLPPQEQAHMDMEAAFRSQQGPQFDASEFARFQAEQQQNVQMVTPVATTVPGTTQFYRPHQFSGYQHFNSNLPFQHLQRSQAPAVAQQQPQQQQQQGKGKEKMMELDDENWEAQFKELEHAQDEALDEEAQKAIEEELQRQGETMFGDFQSVWDGINADTLANGFDYNAEFDSTKNWEPEFSATKSIPSHGEYMFEPDNPYLQMDDPFAEGKRLMETGGNLSLAALAFEAAVQKNKEHIEAWTMLGSAQAQNEKETPAIRALETALKLDPTNLNAMMNLAISYTNEGYETIAFTTLERWLSTKYPQLTSDLPPLLSTIDRQALHDRVTSLFIQAAQLSPEGATMDSDVQVGLGVLFYGNEEYDKAVDCFNAALAHDYDARDKNHLLWNRLGATLANSNRSEEAITAYERALQINPNFVRARYNLGVSCINIGCYDQAAQHLLSALAMHKVAEEKARQDAGKVGLDPNIVMNQSTNLVDTLRRVFTTMGRRDLADLVQAGMDVDVFRGEFDF